MFASIQSPQAIPRATQTVNPRGVRTVWPTAVHDMPLMVATMPEKDEPVRTMTAASINDAKSRKAFKAALGSAEACVCVSPPSSIWTPCKPLVAISSMHSRARSLLSAGKVGAK